MSALAVLEHVGDVGDVVVTPGHRWRVARPIHGLEDLEAIAASLAAHQFWLHPSWSAAHPEIRLCAACVHPNEKYRHEHWQALESGGRLAIVVDDANLPRELRAAVDGAELLRLLLTTRALLGTEWHGTGGRTGWVLLEDGLKRSGHRLSPLPAELRHFTPEPDFGWQRPLSPEERARRYVYVFDKHNQYLTAAQSVVLGAGEPEFRAEPSFHARTPAYWHVKLGSWPADSPLPDPTLAAGPPRDATGYRWLTTPSVEAALSAGLVESIAACWHWPRSGRYLQVFANHLRRAIVQAPDPAVRGVVKSVYAELLGGYLARTALHNVDDPRYRADWRDLVKAEARCRLWYSLRPLVAAGCAPFAVARDSIYVASDAPTATDVLRGLLRIGARPTEWALKARVPLSECSRALVDHVGRCRGLVATVSALEAAA